MSAGCEFSLLGVPILLRGQPRQLATILDELGGLVPSNARPEQSSEPGASATEPPVALIEVTGRSAGEVLAELTGIAVTRSPLLCIHAGVVVGNNGSVVIPGSSGLGKTTLTAALVQAGFGYLSDEVLAVGSAEVAPAPFARPMALGLESWSLLGLDPTLRPEPGDEALARVTVLGRLGAPAPVCEVLLVQRRPGPADLQPAPRGRAVPALLSHSFNHFRDPAGSFHTVLGLVRRSRVWLAGYQQAPELAELLASRWLPTTPES